MRTHNRAELILNLINTSLSEVGISEILKQLDTPITNGQLSIEDLSEDWKDYVHSMRLHILNSHVALQTAHALLTSSAPPSNVNSLPEEVLYLARAEIKKSVKHSSTTTTSNKERTVPLSNQAKAALFAAFLEFRGKDGEEPGWKRVSDRAKHILRRDLELRKEAELLTKARVSTWIKMFKTLDEHDLTISNEKLFEIYDLPKEPR